MAGVTGSIEKFNAREQLLSSDLMRAQLLHEYATPNLEAARSGSADSTRLLNLLGSPIYGVNKPQHIVPAEGYAATIGAGSGFIDNPALVGLTGDDSSSRRSLVGRLTSPSRTRPAPTRGSTSSSRRRQWRTPIRRAAASWSTSVTRAITSASLFKTTDPVATISIVTGVAAAVPSVPAIPAGALPLFYVYVPSGAATAARFGVSRASWRRSVYPFASTSGVVSGCGCTWDLAADPAASSSAIRMKGLKRVVIDGEVMEFEANLDSTVGVVVDTANNPFGAAAPATWHTPYYLYLVGGRHNPMPSFNSADEAIVNGSGMSPVTLVESLTAPDVATRRPSANLTVNGQTVTPAGAVYVGLGFVAANTTRRLACIIDGRSPTSGTGRPTNRLVLVRATASNPELAGNPSSKSPICTRAKVVLFPVLAAANEVVGLLPDSGAGAVAPSFSAGLQGCTSFVTMAAGNSDFRTVAGELVWPAGSNGQVWVQGGQIGDTIDIYFNGYDHRVGRFGLHVNP